MMPAASSRHVLLTAAQMAAADQAAVSAGGASSALMAAAGAAVAREIQARWAPTSVVVLCGPGNNGGDGFVLARCLQAAGWPVRVALWGDASALRGDAANAAAAWGPEIAPASPQVLEGAGLIVDALLGAGLNRTPDAGLKALIEGINAASAPVCAVDVPSGLDGTTGQAPGAAVQAALTVTFFRRKPGHVLLPGRSLCGETRCVDIGIPLSVLDNIAHDTWVNDPDLWLSRFPWPQSSDHKYRRGHVLVVGGETMPGASRLACLSAARIGAGMVTLAVPPAAWAVQATALTSVMVEALPADSRLDKALSDARRSVLLIGPGLGRSSLTRSQVLSMLDTKRPCVLDADALSVFADQPEILIRALHPHCVMTPHEGEFARLFMVAGDKRQRACAAAQACGAVVVLKGPDTVIAAPDGSSVINDNAPPTLATAGAGDVLAGAIAGLLAAGMPGFLAACAAVWLHGLAADQQGLGLLAEDLPAAFPQALTTLARLGEPQRHTYG
ncbi:NAD(P)H-hydrate dehydratase [Castellaniella sp.]|uniref:NAD(P)H-hydrate dehydratase n=1 Tax=Castellaniella sp. TaxID=1955812 RepID=UPI003A900E4E